LPIQQQHGGVDGHEVTAFAASTDCERQRCVIKVGSIVDQRLDLVTFQAVLRLSIRDDIKLPADTAARILSDSLLGGNYLSLEPGGADEIIEADGEMSVTQDPVNIADLLGRFVFGSASEKSGQGTDGAAQP
jgi:phospholipid/cholesterol/gamma-HCH transport system substrate-binding protein